MKILMSILFAFWLTACASQKVVVKSEAPFQKEQASVGSSMQADRTPAEYPDGWSSRACQAEGVQEGRAIVFISTCKPLVPTARTIRLSHRYCAEGWLERVQKAANISEDLVAFDFGPEAGVSATCEIRRETKIWKYLADGYTATTFMIDEREVVQLVK